LAGVAGKDKPMMIIELLKTTFLAAAAAAAGELEYSLESFKTHQQQSCRECMVKWWSSSREPTSEHSNKKRA
jgi:hypothetical protein